MTMKLNVGLSRKVGEANYGSRGASVHLEVEVESALAAEPAQLQERIRLLFRLARQSVDSELSGNGQAGGPHPDQHDSGNGRQQGSERMATASQVRAIHAIANRHRADLPALLREQGVEQPEQLSISQASRMIDELKGAGAGAGR